MSSMQWGGEGQRIYLVFGISQVERERRSSYDQGKGLYFGRSVGITMDWPLGLVFHKSLVMRMQHLF